jgi:hypothetical protein
MQYASTSKIRALSAAGIAVPHRSRMRIPACFDLVHLDLPSTLHEAHADALLQVELAAWCDAINQPHIRLVKSLTTVRSFATLGV